MSTIPAYKKIYIDLKNKIYNGTYSYKSRLPTEMALAAHYGVSRITSKRALDELAKEKWILRQPGKGSFVSYRSSMKRSTVIGIVLSFTTNHGLNNYLEGLRAGLEQTDYTLKLFYTNKDHSSIKEFDQWIQKQQLAGVILQTSLPRKTLDSVMQYFYQGMPVVLLNQEWDGLSLPTVVSDDFSGGYKATRHAIANGHRHILFFSQVQPYSHPAVRKRYLGYLKALSESHLSLPMVHSNAAELKSPLTAQTNQLLLQEWQEQGVTCVLFENDVLAIEFLSAASLMEWSIPQEISLIGFDGIPLGQLLSPRLTTIKQPFFEIGFQAAASLLDQLMPFNKEESVSKKRMAAVSLVEQQTVQFLKKESETKGV